MIGNTRTIRLKRNWHEPSVVWSAIVGDSGTLKSPAYKMIVSYLNNLEKGRIQEHAAKRSEYEEAKAQYDRDKAKQAAGRPVPTRPVEPVCSRLLCSDITIERIAGLLADNPRGLLIGRDELGGWFASFTRYKGKSAGSDLPQWLEMFRAETLIVDRKTGERPTIFVPRAAVSVTGTIQPGTLKRALTAEQLEAGLGARILLAMPPKVAKKWTEVEIHPDTQQAYERLIDDLLALDFAEDSQGDAAPFALPLSHDAKQRFVQFYNEWARLQADAEGDLASVYSKLEAYAARFALIHSVVTHVTKGTADSQVEAESVEAAVELVRWFAAETRRIYTALAESDDDRHTRRLIDLIRCKGGRITARELQRSNSRRFPNAEAAEKDLQLLIDAGLADWSAKPAGAKGGHTVKVCILKPCPTHDTTDTRPGGDDDDEADGMTQAHDTTATDPSISAENGASVGSVMRHAHENGRPEGEAKPRGLCQVRERVSVPDDTKEVFPPDPPKRGKP